MSDSTKVYGGGVPQGGFDAEQANAGFSVSSEAESGQQFGGPANAPKVVKEGGPTVGKTYSKSASENFLSDKSYTTAGSGLSVRTDFDMGGGKTVNPDDISHADNC